MCAARSHPAEPQAHRLQPAAAFRRRFKPHPPANDNASPRSWAWRTAGAILGAAVAGGTALAAVLLTL